MELLKAINTILENECDKEEICIYCEYYSTHGCPIEKIINIIDEVVN